MRCCGEVPEFVVDAVKETLARCCISVKSRTVCGKVLTPNATSFLLLGLHIDFMSMLCALRQSENATWKTSYIGSMILAERVVSINKKPSVSASTVPFCPRHGTDIPRLWSCTGLLLTLSLTRKRPFNYHGSLSTIPSFPSFLLNLVQ
jgi:hypothetical protein